MCKVIVISIIWIESAAASKRSGIFNKNSSVSSWVTSVTRCSKQVKHIFLPNSYFDFDEYKVSQMPLDWCLLFFRSHHNFSGRNGANTECAYSVAHSMRSNESQHFFHHSHRLRSNWNQFRVRFSSWAGVWPLSFGFSRLRFVFLFFWSLTTNAIRCCRAQRNKLQI